MAFNELSVHLQTVYGDLLGLAEFLLELSATLPMESRQDLVDCSWMTGQAAERVSWVTWKFRTSYGAVNLVHFFI